MKYYRNHLSLKTYLLFDQGQLLFEKTHFGRSLRDKDYSYNPEPFRMQIVRIDKYPYVSLLLFNSSNNAIVPGSLRELDFVRRGEIPEDLIL